MKNFNWRHTLLFSLFATTALGVSYKRYLQPFIISDSLKVGADSAPTTDAVFEVVSTSEGSIICPKMTTAQRDAIGVPSEGMCVANTDTNKLNYYNGTTWGEIAGGGGGLDSFHQETFEVTDASDFLTGSNATFGGGGSLVGTLGDETSDPIAPPESLIYTMSTGCANDYAESPEISIDDKQAGNWIGLTMFYKMSAATDSVRWIVYDETNDAELASGNLEQATNPTRFSMAAYVPTGVTSLRYGFQVETCTNTETLVADDIELTSDPFVYKDIVKKNEISLRGNDGRAITATTEDVHFSGSGTGWTSSGDTHYYTVQNENSTIFMDGSVYFTSAVGTRFRLYKNGTFYKNLSQGASTTLAHKFQTVLAPGETAAGDQLSIRSTGSGTLDGTSSDEEHNLTISEQWQVEHVVTAAQSSETETKILSADVSTSTNPVSDLTFSNLVIGQKYFLNFQARLLVTDGESATLTANHNGSVIATLENNIQRTVAGDIITIGTSVFFTAAASTVTFNYIDGGLNSTLLGNNTQEETWAQLTNVTAQFLAAIPTQETAYIKDRKPSGTDAGGATANTVQTRDLNTLEGDTSWVSLSSNQFTLAPGKYEIWAQAPAYDVDTHQAFLYNVTDGTYDIDGSPNYQNAATISGYSVLMGQIEITTSKTYEIRHWFQQTKATNGLGFFGDRHPSNPQSQEVFTQVKITKIS